MKSWAPARVEVAMLLLALIACGAPDPTAPSLTAPTGSRQPDGPVRFVAFGDAGTGSPAQAQVGRAMAAVCAQRGCDFALGLGDNLYPKGAANPDGEKFQKCFEVPYADLDMPFYMTLGNHDYGGSTLSQERAGHQVAYSARSEKWTMPAPYYSVRAGDVRLFALDTNALYSGWFLGWGRDQIAWIDAALSEDDGQTWTIIFGHHPYRSNGQHGDAGDYEGWGLGGWIDDFYAESICGRADLVLSGHDHNRQWLAPTCGTEWVVSGAGAKVVPLVDREGRGALFADDKEPGFAWFEIDGAVLTGAFYDADGALDFTRRVERQITESEAPSF